MLGMSLRVLYKAGDSGDAFLGMKEQVSKCDSSLKTLRDSTGCSSSTKQARRFSKPIDSTAFKAPDNDRLKQAEESLRTVLYLSCWGPN